MLKRVLFLCSGNYYRSRYAEELFNHLATRERLCWHAFSRALRTDGLELNIGSISLLVIEGLRKKNIKSRTSSRFPLVCDLVDLKNAEVVIAMKEAEHRPLIRTRFPDKEDLITYWHVDDIDCAQPQDALPQIDRLILELMPKLRER